MKIGIVLPHHEIGSNPDDMKAFAMGAEALGADLSCCMTMCWVPTEIAQADLRALTIKTPNFMNR